MARHNVDRKVLILEDVNVPFKFRNFAGEAGRYNKAGDRFFSVFLDPDKAEELEAEGWNIKYLKPREDDPEGPQAILPVKVSYDNIPPVVRLVTSRGEELLDEETIGLVDHADIVEMDVSINPYRWKLDTGETGIKAYLKSAWITIYEDDLDRKYAARGH